MFKQNLEQYVNEFINFFNNHITQIDFSQKVTQNCISIS